MLFHRETNGKRPVRKLILIMGLRTGRQKLPGEFANGMAEMSLRTGWLSLRTGWLSLRTARPIPLAEFANGLAEFANGPFANSFRARASGCPFANSFGLEGSRHHSPCNTMYIYIYVYNYITICACFLTNAAKPNCAKRLN